MSFIKVPFAASGDKTPVPETDGGGGVNMTQGYTQAYALDPASDPSARRIEREKMNALFNMITVAINEIQTRGIAPFITASENGGSAFSYGKGALVSMSGVNYQSLEDANTTTPPNVKWAAVPATIQPLDATLTTLAALATGANKLPYFSGVDTASQTDLTQVGRDIIGKATTDDVLQYLQISDGLIPVGIPLPWPLATPPAGWLKCNGAAFDKTKYPKLAAAYPSGLLPDLRGEFIRGWDDGRGVDAARSLLSRQDSQNMRHAHQEIAAFNMNGNLNGWSMYPSSVYAKRYYEKQDGLFERPANGWTGASGGLGTTVDGGNEARPLNTAYNMILRAA